MPKYKKQTLKKKKMTKHKKNKTRYISKKKRIFKNRKYNGGDIIQPTYVPYADGGTFNKLHVDLNKNMIQSNADASLDNVK